MNGVAGNSDGKSPYPMRRHLRRLTDVFIDPPVFLITICTIGRREGLVRGRMPGRMIEALRTARADNSWRLGLFVIMPDHLHFFCTPGEDARSLSTFVGGFKQASTRWAWRLGWRGRLWQREFYDHLLRSSEAYAEKCQYVLMNPVRARLCERPEDWPHSGMIDEL